MKFKYKKMLSFLLLIVFNLMDASDLNSNFSSLLSIKTSKTSEMSEVRSSCLGPSILEIANAHQQVQESILTHSKKIQKNNEKIKTDGSQGCIILERNDRAFIPKTIINQKNITDFNKQTKLKKTVFFSCFPFF